ncbi:MAG: Gfo/Idh/MocA family oxidoreductase [Actinomycetota bacterium]|nr:Gfo/Idh/MocA family oxidoreductase [Actinomycetota bacterium]
MMRVGLLGCAHVHAAHYVAALRAGDIGARAVALYDPDSEQAAAFAAAHGLERATDAASLCGAVDAVIVVSEHSRYVEMVQSAARAGLPVLCEKPFGASLGDLRTLLATDVWCSVAFPMRYAPPLVRAKAMIEQGGLGELVAMSGTNRGSYPGGFFGDRARSGGGALIDHVVHVADALYVLSGLEYETVYAEAGRFRNVGDVEDVAQVLATTTSGAFASIDSSWSRPAAMPGGLDFQMTLWFERATLHLDGMARRGLVVAADGSIDYEEYGRGVNEAMLSAWVRAIESGAAPPIPALDGARATELALGALRSAETGRVVDLAALR